MSLIDMNALREAEILQMGVWQPMATAPRDGTPILLLQAHVLVGQGRSRAIPRLTSLRREWIGGERVGAGYWVIPGIRSVADHEASGLWAPKDALPLDALRKGEAPGELPAPWASFTSAPQDGRWFIALVPWYHLTPDLMLLRRRDVEQWRWESSRSFDGGGVAESYLAGAIWAELDAMPLHALYGAPLPEPLA